MRSRKKAGSRGRDAAGSWGAGAVSQPAGSRGDGEGVGRRLLAGPAPPIVYVEELGADDLVFSPEGGAGYNYGSVYAWVKFRF